MIFNELNLLRNTSRSINEITYLSDLINDREYVFRRLWSIKLGFYRFLDFNLHVTQRDEHSPRLFLISNSAAEYYSLYWLKSFWLLSDKITEDVDFITRAEWKLTHNQGIRE